MMMLITMSYLKGNYAKTWTTRLKKFHNKVDLFNEDEEDEDESWHSSDEEINSQSLINNEKEKYDLIDSSLENQNISFGNEELNLIDQNKIEHPYYRFIMSD